MRPLRRGRKRPRDPRSGSDRPAPERRSSASAGGSSRRLAAQRATAAGSALLGLARLLAGALQEIWGAIVAAAEVLGRLELRLGRLISIPLRGMLRAGRAAIAIGERVVTPARAVGAVVLAAAVLLGASQFVDYRGVGIGVPLYEGVEAVAPPPQTDREPAGSAHSYVLLPVAILAIAALVFALRGRWRLGRVISLLGLVGIAVSLLIDVPKGLDEGLAARDFEGAEATLLEGFWAQLASASVLVVTGLLLARYVRLEQPAERRERRSQRRMRRRAAPAAGVRA
jgi:hypothetical protein